jgi:hypothetical protein
VGGMVRHNDDLNSQHPRTLKGVCLRSRRSGSFLVRSNRHTEVDDELLG